MTSTSLPRELLRWLNTLDLTFSLKNHRRSFSNGFLIAEILARYFPQDISLHGFDTSTGKRSRNNNWAVLERILAKKGIKIEREVIQQTIDEVPGAVEIILMATHKYISLNTTNGNIGTGHSNSIATGMTGNGDRGLRHEHGIVHIPSQIPRDKILATAAAAALLSLEDIPGEHTSVWDLLVQCVDFNSWDDINRAPQRYHPEHILQQLKSKTLEFNIATKTEYSSKLVELLTMLWRGFFYSHGSKAYQVACIVTRFFLPICQENQPRMYELLYTSMQILAPLDELPELNRKLSDIALVVGSIAKGQEGEVLRIFKEQLPSEIYIFLLASFQQYDKLDFWLSELNRYISTFENTLRGQSDPLSIPVIQSRVPIFQSSQLDTIANGLLCYCCTLVSQPWKADISYARQVIQLVNTRPLSEFNIYFMCIISCRVLHILSSETAMSEAHHEWYQTLDQAKQCSGITLLLGVVHEMLPILLQHRCLANLFVVLLSKIRNFEILSSPATVQPVPYAQTMFFKPILVRCTELKYNGLTEIIGMGLVSWLQQGHKLESMKMLLPYVISKNVRSNACILAHLHEHLLEDVLEHDTWEMIKKWISVSEPLAIQQILPAIIVTMAFHLIRSPSHPVSIQMAQDLQAFALSNTIFFRNLADRWQLFIVSADLLDQSSVTL